MTNRRLQAAILSLLVALFILGIKFGAYFITSSSAIFSDALEGLVNVAASVLLIAVIFISSRPPDQTHPYGHGKFEFFSAAFEGGLLLFAGVLILIQAGARLWVGPALFSLNTGLVMIMAAALINLGLGNWLISIGRKENSPALLASGYHVLSDCWTSGAVFLGLMAVKFTGLVWIDPLIAIGLGLYISYIGVGICRKSFGALVDERDVGALEALETAFSRNRKPGIIQLHHVRVMRLGRYHHIDAHVVVPEFWSVEKAHDETVRFEKKVIESYPCEGEINFHIDPCRQAYCSRCDLPDCPVRREPFRELTPIPFEELVSPDEPEKSS